MGPAFLTLNKGSMMARNNFSVLKIFLAVVLLIAASLACQVMVPDTNSSQSDALPDSTAVQAEPDGSAQDTADDPAAPASSGDPVSVGSNSPAVLLLPESDLTALYDQVNRGVVSLRVFSESGGGLGSGFVIDKAGHIVTNYHVVRDVSEVEVDFPGGFKTFGQVIGTDLDSDLAIIKVEAPEEELFPLPLGNSDDLKVGQFVVAIGNPFGFSGTMTVGVVSAKGRVLSSFNEAPAGNFFSAGDLIQTDAAINPGNSGGPLINLDGEVIGINRAIISDNSNGSTGSNSGISFAISVNILNRVLDDLIEFGTYDYPYLGLSSLPEISLFAQEQLGLPRATGALVTQVITGGPAGDAGIETGDIIISIDGLEVLNFGDLIGYLITKKGPGDTVDLEVLREDEVLILPVVLGSRP
jgi:2-alkenal reductase